MPIVPVFVAVSSAIAVPIVGAVEVRAVVVAVAVAEAATANGSTNTTKSKAGGTSKALMSKQLANKCVALKKQKARHKQDLTWYRAVLGKGKGSGGAKGGGCKGNGKGRGKGQRLRGTRK